MEVRDDVVQFIGMVMTQLRYPYGIAKQQSYGVPLSLFHHKTVVFWCPFVPMASQSS
jgi:hypothetical protein